MSFDLGRDMAKAARSMGADEARQVTPLFGRGIVASFETGVAAVQKGGASAPSTGGFRVPPRLLVEVGDVVFYYEQGSDRMILEILSRSSVPNLSLAPTELTLAGSLLVTGVLSLTLTATVNDYDPDGAEEARVWRIDQSGGAWSITGMLAQPGAERELYNISAGNLTLEHEHANSAAANRFAGSGGVDLVIPAGGRGHAWYDDLSLRWRVSS
jgi:hypothetical protein